MVNHLYSIYDSKTGVFNNPFVCRNVDEAKRIVAATATADVHNSMNLHHERLHCKRFWNYKTG